MDFRALRLRPEDVFFRKVMALIHRPGKSNCWPKFQTVSSASIRKYLKKGESEHGIMCFSSNTQVIIRTSIYQRTIICACAPYFTSTYLCLLQQRHVKVNKLKKGSNGLKPSHNSIASTLSSKLVNIYINCEYDFKVLIMLTMKRSYL